MTLKQPNDLNSYGAEGSLKNQIASQMFSRQRPFERNSEKINRRKQRKRRKSSDLCLLLFNASADPYARPLHVLALRVLRAAQPHALLGLAAGGLAMGQRTVALT